PGATPSSARRLKFPNLRKRANKRAALPRSARFCFRHRNRVGQPFCLDCVASIRITDHIVEGAMLAGFLTQDTARHSLSIITGPYRFAAEHAILLVIDAQ